MMLYFFHQIRKQPMNEINHAYFLYPIGKTFLLELIDRSDALKKNPEHIIQLKDKSCH